MARFVSSSLYPLYLQTQAALARARTVHGADLRVHIVDVAELGTESGSSVSRYSSPATFWPANSAPAFNLLLQLAQAIELQLRTTSNHIALVADRDHLPLLLTVVLSFCNIYPPRLHEKNAHALFAFMEAWVGSSLGATNSNGTHQIHARHWVRFLITADIHAHLQQEILTY